MERQSEKKKNRDKIKTSRKKHNMKKQQQKKHFYSLTAHFCFILASHIPHL